MMFVLVVVGVMAVGTVALAVDLGLGLIRGDTNSRGQMW